jgi:hypothetical protein
MHLDEAVEAIAETTAVFGRLPSLETRKGALGMNARCGANSGDKKPEAREIGPAG